MMISQTALDCLEATWRRIRDHPAHSAPETNAGRASSARTIPRNTADRAVSSQLEHAGAPAEANTRPHPVLAADATVTVATDPTAPLTAPERRARAAALRALALGRGRRFAAARAAFVEAARLDPALDLTRTPAFWQLERAAHEAAIDAYVEVGRDRDAAVLRARVQSTFRPKPLRSRQQPALSP
jgi:hypothetical protein